MQNQNFEIALKLIIPAILLIFWALSNLFNRQQNSMQQARDRNSGLGPRPGNFTPPRERMTGNPSFQPPRPQPKSDDIIIIRSETNRPPVRTTAPRRQQGRQRPAATRRPEPPPPPPKEQLGGRIQSDVNHNLAKPFDVRPLNEQIANTVTKVDAEAPVGATMGVTITPVASALELFAALASKGRIREAFILNEILQPPVSQRRRRQA